MSVWQRRNVLVMNLNEKIFETFKIICILAGGAECRHWGWGSTLYIMVVRCALIREFYFRKFRGLFELLMRTSRAFMFSSKNNLIVNPFFIRRLIHCLTSVLSEMQFFRNLFRLQIIKQIHVVICFPQSTRDYEHHQAELKKHL